METISLAMETILFVMETISFMMEMISFMMETIVFAMEAQWCLALSTLPILISALISKDTKIGDVNDTLVTPPLNDLPGDDEGAGSLSVVLIEFLRILWAEPGHADFFCPGPC
jgi:hypothetical protein